MPYFYRLVILNVFKISKCPLRDHDNFDFVYSFQKFINSNDHNMKNLFDLKSFMGENVCMFVQYDIQNIRSFSEQL